MLTNRTSRVHETAAFQKHAVVSGDYADFRVDERVMTCDGFPGRVAAVEDGPYPSTEQYIVELDGGMGGGAYTASQLQKLPQVSATDHTAADDYPELGDILVRRPDIALG